MFEQALASSRISTASAPRIFPAPWTAFRTYRHRDECRAILFNELEHEMVLLEGAAASLWGAIEGGVDPRELESISCAQGLELSEVEDFIEELIEHRLLVREDSHIPTRANPAPIVQRLEFASNSTDELELIEWCMSRGFLYTVQWEGTYRCNESCVHCYNPGAAHHPDERPNRKRDELSTDEAKAIFKELAELGVFRLILSGGEITLRRDFFELVEYARKLGFSVAIYTNGLSADEAFVERLAALWPSSVSISIYSAEPELHDAITRVPNSFAKSVDALKRLNARGIKTYMKSPQMAHTVDGYEATRALAESIGAGPEIDMHFSDGADGASLTDALAVRSPRTLIRMAMTPGSPLSVGDASEGFGRMSKDQDATVCGSGTSIMYLDPEGKISPCASMPIGAVNIRDGGVADVWKRSPIGKHGPWSDDVDDPSNEERDAEVNAETIHWWQSIRLRDYRECSTHRRCGWCTKCPGLAYLEYGDVLGPSSLNCRNAGARMIAADLLEAGFTVDDLLEDERPAAPRVKRSLPLVGVQPHESRLFNRINDDEALEGSEARASYRSVYRGLDLNAGPASAAAALESLDRYVQRVWASKPESARSDAPATLAAPPNGAWSRHHED